MTRTAWRAPLAWTVAIVSATFLVAAFVVALVTAPGAEEGLGVVWVLSWVGFPLVGGMIVSRRSGNAVGWRLLGIGAFVGAALFESIYLGYAIEHPGADLPAVDLVAWSQQLLLIAALALVPSMVLVFPSGTLSSARWRIVARVGRLIFVVLGFAYAFRSIVEVGEGVLVANPLAVPGLAPILESVIPFLFGAGVLYAFSSFVNLVWRYIRSRGAARKQIKWFVYSAALIPVFFGGSFFVPRGAQDIAILIAFVVGLNGMAAAIGVAVLRYRLYDIDRVVSRTVSYAVVTGILVGAYVGLVVLFQRVLSPLTGSSDLAVAVSTLIVAAAFVPVRRRVQGVVDHRFNRHRYDAERTIDAFSTRMRDEVDVDALGAELEDVVGQTMQPAHVSLWVRGVST